MAGRTAVGVMAPQLSWVSEGLNRLGHIHCSQEAAVRSRRFARRQSHSCARSRPTRGRGLRGRAISATFSCSQFPNFVVNFYCSKSATIASHLESRLLRVLHCPPKHPVRNPGMLVQFVGPLPVIPSIKIHKLSTGDGRTYFTKPCATSLRSR
jgi:hypothetical protein